jgi:ribose transport system substrate-binding protein
MVTGRPGVSRWRLTGLIGVLTLAPLGCTIERVDSPEAVGDGSRSTAKGPLDAAQAVPLPAGQKPVVAFVTNGIASFWNVAEAGCRAAERDFDCRCEVRMPPNASPADQKRMLEELLSQGVQGIAVSPINPENQAALLNEVAAQTYLITQDSDAPTTERLAYVGMDNYTAGRMCGELIREALPDGGQVMLFVGRLGQLNADLRRQGLIDELLGREPDASRRDPPEAELSGGGYTILDTRTDNFDFAAAKAQAEDAIAKYPQLGCMVGLFAYNPPYLFEALKGAGKLGQIQLVGFDEDPATLQAIADGHCYGTIVQNPYRYGYESVRILAGLARGERSVLPAGGTLHIPARKIRDDNVREFQAELAALTSGTSAAGTQGSADQRAAGEEAAGQPGTGSGTGRPDGTPRRVRLAFVTNNPSDFWKIAEAGVRRAEEEFGVECEVQFPPNGTADDQQRIVEALIAKGIAGMAISPNDPVNQVDLLNRIAEMMPLICHDSDAAESNRLAYVGTRNYRAGREAGKQIKSVLPAGGKIAIFVGRMDAQNAMEREQGVRDELADSDMIVLPTLTDLTDRARAKQNVEDTLARHPDIGCLVGLWSYNGPAILEAVIDAGQAGRIPIVCFDEETRTLQGVRDGHIHATVVQQPYQFGYQSVRILAALARGQDAGIPADKIVEVPVRVIRRDNVDAFWDELRRLTGQ